MRHVLTLLAMTLTLTACGQTQFTASGDVSTVANSASLESGDEASGEIRQVADLIADPELANLYSCGRKAGKKVLICHVPEGNPGNAYTLCIGAAALSAHIDLHEAASGEKDTLGECPLRNGP